MPYLKDPLNQGFGEPHGISKKRIFKIFQDLVLIVRVVLELHQEILNFLFFRAGKEP